jgi:WD40 repeat protein
MPMPATCPACAAAFSVPRKMAGRKLFCPKCGQALVVTGAGVARAAGQAAPPPTTYHWAVLILVALGVILGAGGAVAVVLLNQGGPEEHREAAQHDPGQAHKPEESQGQKAPPQGADQKAQGKAQGKGDAGGAVGVKQQAQGPQPVSVTPLRTLGPQPWGTNVLVFSPDDRTLAAGGGNIPSAPADIYGEFKLWDVATGAFHTTLTVQGSVPQSLAFGPGGKTLVMGNYAVRNTNRSEAQVWDVAGGKLLRTVTDDMMGMAPWLSRDGKFLATVPWTTSNVAVWDLGTGKRTALLEGHTARPWIMTFGPDGKVLASAGDDRTIILWDLASGKSRWGVPAGDRLTSSAALAFSPDGKTLAGGLTEKGDALQLLDVATGKRVASLPVFADRPPGAGRDYHLAYSPDGKLLAVATSTGARLWDVASGKVVATLADKACNGVVFSHDGKLLAGSMGLTVTLWQVTGGGEHRLDVEDPVAPAKRGPVVLRGHTGPVFTVLFTGDGSTLISGGGSQTDKEPTDTGEIKRWDVSSGKVTGSFRGPYPFVYSLALSPDGATLAASLYGGAIPLLDAATGKERFSLESVPESVLSKPWRDHYGVAFSPDGKTVAAANSGRMLILWDVATRKNTRNLDLATQSTWNRMGPGMGYCLAFSPDGKTLAGGDSYGINLWDVPSGKLTANLTGHVIDPKKGNTATVFSVAFSPDGKTLASGGADGTVKLWDLASGKCTATLAGHSVDVVIRSVAFSRDGKLLASAGGVYGDETTGKGEIRVWDVAGGQVIHRFPQETGQAISVAFSPNGRLLASGNGDGTVRLWDVSGAATAPPGKGKQ